MKLTDRIAEIMNLEVKPSNYTSMRLIPPVVLMLQLIEMTSGSANNITSVFQSLNIPFNPIYFLKQYIPFLDWDTFENKSKMYALSKQLDFELQANQQAEMAKAQQQQY